MREQLIQRTKSIGLAVIHLTADLPNKPAAWVLSKQVIRSATSVGANYRATCRAKSKPDFINKLKIVEEESDETLHWLEMLEEAKLVDSAQIQPIKKEVNEIIAIVVAAIKTSRGKE